MMWMKRLVAATAAIAMLGALSGCGSKNDSSTADNGNGLSNNKFVVGFDAAFPPSIGSAVPAVPAAVIFSPSAALFSSIVSVLS